MQTSNVARMRILQNAPTRQIRRVLQAWKYGLSRSIGGSVPIAAIAAFEVGAPCARRLGLLIESMLPSDIDLLSDLDRIVDLYPKVAHSALDL